MAFLRSSSPTPSRNSLCPCGSGKKYKKCHGRLDSPADPPIEHVGLPEAVYAALQRRIDEETRHKRTYGDVKEMISVEFQGHRVVASGSTLYYDRSWKVFPDFLNVYLTRKLGAEWGKKQVQLPLPEQHPIVQWRTIFLTAQMEDVPNEAGFFNSKTGASEAWFRLAYDLYLIENNAKLQKRLIQRLREPPQFQGARFEAAVAAMMLAAGYELEFATEKGPGKQPEFVATRRSDGHKVAVEAKSRHRPGILGFPGEVVVPNKFDIARLLREALEKDTEVPLLVFIELNSPRLVYDESGEDFYDELNASWLDAQELEWPNGFPAIGVIFYNDANHWFLERAPDVGGKPIMAMTFWPRRSRHNFDALPLLEKIAEGCYQRLNIPKDFPKAK